MRSTFSVLFYTKNQSLKDGKVPIMGCQGQEGEGEIRRGQTAEPGA